MPLTLVPIQGVARYGIARDASGLGASYPHSDLHGAGHLGVSPLERIILSLELGIESEVQYALSTLTFYLYNEPALIDFKTNPIIGTELIAHGTRPYLALAADAHAAATNTAAVSRETLAISAEALLLLRNAVQDLPNQQWLSQVPLFRKHAAETMRFLVGHLYTPKRAPRGLEQHDAVFAEALRHLLDILETVSSFYTDTPRHDPLFAQLLLLFRSTNDKHVLVVLLRCLQHLLYLGGPDAVAPRDPDDTTPNCVDAVQPEHLHIVVNSLLVYDDELTAAVLLFLNQYLRSQALHPDYRLSARASQLHRLRKLVDAAGDCQSLAVLFKQLPELVVANLPLVDPARLPLLPPVHLLKRLSYSGVPPATPKLPEKLYNIIVTFPEPLRATTWLRCCYEPLLIPKTPAGGAADPATGEVTQISLWKSYENQFEAIWKDRYNTAWPNLLPAVDFIKNVSSAFPNSEAMVVNIPPTDAALPARKKFIIKGIQPRESPVSIDTGNFEALRKTFAEEKAAELAEVGAIDTAAFERALAEFNDSLVSASEGLTGPRDKTAPWYSPVNQLAKEILDTLVSSLLDPDTEGKYRAVFRQYNKDWMPELIYANPGLIEHGYVDAKWLQHLL